MLKLNTNFILLHDLHCADSEETRLYLNPSTIECFRAYDTGTIIWCGKNVVKVKESVDEVTKMLFGEE